jgi:hypothetical protein
MLRLLSHAGKTRDPAERAATGQERLQKIWNRNRHNSGLPCAASGSDGRAAGAGD